ncbi:DUF3800 domain-containing protein [Photobacterium damselae]|uniref:DUF3800 domain-containing protein n=1 Tax=Photobacterium damselae TaxID=38293 RepID=UPI0015E6B72B|nr:DUF3800 domain-containing protein [Photobacterium damselae]
MIDDVLIDTVLNKKEEKENKTEEKKLSLLKSVYDCNFSTMEYRIGWILNHFPECRNSDIACQLRYWHVFQPELFDINRGVLTVDNYKLLQPLTSISRPRATIQNSYNLFLADDAVRKYRGTLNNEQKEKAIALRNNTDKSYLVYSDESGKTDKTLLVGSLWILDGIDTAKLMMAVDKWREKHNFKRELHFKEIKKGNIDYYLDLIDVLKANSTAISFKALGVERAGIGDVNSGLRSMFYYLLIDGVKHENDTGRAELPRQLNFIKDEEEVGSDQLMLRDIKDRIETYSATQYDKKLIVNDFRALPSKDNLFIQIADLFTGSINRKVNIENSGSPKDIFAEKFLKEFNVTTTDQHFDLVGDCAIYANL